MSLDPYTFPAIVPEGEFLNSPVRSTSPPQIRRFPPYPAAGGWGNGGSRCVYSVGLCGWPAGGAEVTAAWSEWRLGAVSVFVAGGTPGRSTAMLPPSPRLQVPGAAWRGFPSPVSVERRSRVMNNWKMLIWGKSTDSTEQDGGSSGPRSDDFPSAEGLCPVQGQGGGVAAAHRRSVLFVVEDVGSQLDLFVNFLFARDRSVRTLLL